MEIKTSKNSEMSGFNKDLELEILTEKFIGGKITLDTYRKKMNEMELDARLDLRRVASKLKPLLIFNKPSKL